MKFTRSTVCRSNGYHRPAIQVANAIEQNKRCESDQEHHEAAVAGHTGAWRPSQQGQFADCLFALSSSPSLCFIPSPSFHFSALSPARNCNAGYPHPSCKKRRRSRQGRSETLQQPYVKSVRSKNLAPMKLTPDSAHSTSTHRAET